MTDTTKDPDPIAIAGLVVSLASLVHSWLEARRAGTDTNVEQERDRRAAILRGEMVLRRAEAQVAELQKLAADYGFGHEPARPGAVRLRLNEAERGLLKEMQVQVLRLVQELTEAMDELSDHVSEGYERQLLEITAAVGELEAARGHASYGELLGRTVQVLAQYRGLLDTLATSPSD